MSKVVITIYPYARRGARIASLAPIRATDAKFAVRRAAQLASGSQGAIVLAEGIGDDGELIASMEIARFGVTPEVADE